MNYGPTETLLMGLHGLIGTGVIVAGTVALLSCKGRSLHRLTGKLFVAQLFLMGAVIAASWLCAAAGLVSTLGIVYVALILYLVLTSWATVAAPPKTVDRLGHAAPMMAAAIALLALFWGWQVQTGRQTVPADIPVAAYHAFAAVALLAGVGDMLVLRRGGVAGGQRLLRHLWRMCFALYFSVATLFTGPGSVVFPDSVRGAWPLMIPELSVAALTLYHVARLIQKRWRGWERWTSG